jgi:serine/threonine-protein kinase
MPTQVLNNRYELERPIGQGGMASVYRARDLRLGRAVAVKVLHPRYADDQEFIQRFDHEAMSAARLSAHPHIVDVYDVGEDNNIHYIVMELIEGEDLKWLIDREAPMTINRALPIVEQVADGLEYAHQQGFVHRDIKPQNVLLDREGSPHITDFGIAKSRMSTAVTQMGMTFGTADYLAPEQAQGLDVTPQTDIYSLGIVLYEMLTGRLPFVGDSPMAVAIQQIQQPPPPPRQFNPAITPSLETLLLNALSKNPQQRPPSARLFAMALRDLRLGRAQPTVPYAAQQPASTVALPQGPYPSQTAPSPTVGNGQTVRPGTPRVQPPQQYTAPPRAYEYDDTVPGNYTVPPRSTPTYNRTPPAPAPRPAPQPQHQPQPHYDPRYDEPVSTRYEQPASRSGISGNLVATVFLLLGLALLYFLMTTNTWIEPLRSVVGL